MLIGRRVIFASLLIFVLMPAAWAQRGVGMGGGRAGFGGGPGHFGFPHGRRGDGLAFPWGYPFFYPDTYLQEPMEPREAAPPREPFGPPLQTQADPLMIELQGNRYVRYDGNAVMGAAMDDRSGTENQELPSGTVSTKLVAAAIPPAVLVYRDGHREEIPEYTIVGRTLYAGGGYWQSGSWTRNIQISTLDLPATQIANQQRGVNFVLPSGPNVVVTRP